MSAFLAFDEGEELVDFVSDDRLYSSPRGWVFTPQRRSIPLADHTWIGGRRLVRSGTARVARAGAEGTFTYLQFVIEDLPVQHELPRVG